MNSSDLPVHDPIMVTQATLPPLEEYVGYLKTIWDKHWLTNNGPFVRELEDRLREHLGSPELWYVSNCTTALQLSLRALAPGGDIITTPFTYVATSGAIMWEHFRPVFVDVRPDDLTIDPQLIEAAITPKTRAILATHVYGTPCAVNEIATIARQHRLKVIYDAAHAFGCALAGRPLATYGDMSCLSFHATKVFHTVEGGAVIINGNPELSERIRLMRAFGHFGDDHRCIGINGKNSEFHAAMGLCNLPRYAAYRAMRQALHENYSRLLRGSPLRQPRNQAESFEYNYGYFPVLLPDENAVFRALAALADIKVYPRRYFYPSLNRIAYIKGPNCPVSEHAAATVICLPLSEQVTPAIQQEIATTIAAAVGF